MKMSLVAAAVLAFIVCSADAAEHRNDPPVAAALDWLARHQDPTGFWRSSGFSSRCEGAKCAGDGVADADVGTTGLAILAFLGTGETPNKGDYRDTLKRAATALKERQDETGFIGVRTAPDARRRHAYAAMALIEMYGMTGAKFVREPARLAAACVASMQDASGGWKLVETDAACDTTLTGVCVLTLRSARMSEIEFDARAFDRAVAWLDAPAQKATSAADTRTAASLGARIFGRWDADALAKDPLFAKDAEVLAAEVPEWTDKSSAERLWTWCVAAPPLFQKGGEPWDRWWKAFYRAAKAHQLSAPDRCDRGSWDPIDAHVPFGGRVATTALLCRAMETPYVFGRLPAAK
jgi:hypothetical protein